MFFKKLSLHGFKSFADPVTIEFDKGITCVVGPNGSGKSNISDALRWVLGEQSPKMLRGGKMDEVIFAGTDKRKSRGMAEVTLIIDNSDSSLKIDFSEVSITRRMYRSGESEYYINGSQCRLKDIRELIMDTGIGVDGYSLIGQGKISEIISGKPESRREIFEEAAGIVRYRNKKAETERKLESTTANLERVNDIIAELEERIDPLKTESEKAREYITLNEQYRHTEINVILKNIEQVERQNSTLQNDMNDIEARIFENKKERDGIDADIRKKKLRTEELDAEDYAERDRIMSFNAEMKELENKIRVDKERVKTLEENRRRFEDERKILVEKLNVETTGKKDLQRELEVLTKKSGSNDSEIRTLQRQLKESVLEYEEKTARFNEDRDRLYELSVQSSSKAAEIAGIRSMLNSLQDRKTATEEQYSENTGESSAETLCQNALRKRDELINAQNHTEVQLSSVKKNLSALEERRQNAEIRLSRARIKGSEAQTRKNMLQQLEDSYEGYNYAVRFIMKESGLKNIYGTVGDIIDVPRGYETAIETALGSRVQNIVCRDNSCADDAIRMLKTRKAGRLTFLPAESLRVQARRNEAGMSEEPGFVGIAADCVKFEPQFRKVVEYLLGGIVVVKTLEDALHISARYSGFRYVTFEGEFINPAGAITGGAYKNNNTGGILDRKNRINETDREIFELEKERKEAEDAYNRINYEIVATEGSMKELEENSRNSEIELLNINNDISKFQSQMSSYKDRMDRIGRELERLNQEIEENQSAEALLEKQKFTIDQQMEGIRKSADDMADENDRSQQTINELTERLTTVKVASESVKGEIVNINNLIERMNSRTAEIEKDIEEKIKAGTEADIEQKNLQSRIAHTEEEMKFRQKTHVEHSDRLRLIKEEKEKLSRDTEKASRDKEEKERSLYSLRTLKHDAEMKIEAGASRIENWKNKLWDEFEISYLQAVEHRVVTFDLSDGIKESRRLRNAIKSLGNVNISAIQEYEKVSERYAFLTAQRKDLDEAIASLRKIIEETDVRIRTSFKSSFDAININFKTVFGELFGGGKAELRIDEGMDPLEADIDIVVQPPGKKLQNMNLLSGGEKTMTAIALMFAVLKSKPTPFCILDEVEAALDEANIERFADYLKNFEGIQFVLVTHQKVTMEHANVLYGVTMPEKGISRILSLKLDDADKIESLS